MPARKRARRLGDVPGSSSSERRLGLVLCGAALALLVSVSNCGFPQYAFPDVGSGPGGQSGGAATAGGGTGGSIGGGEGDEGGAAGVTGGTGAVGGGDPGDAGSAGSSGGEPCVFPVPVSYPQHCSNKTLGDGETAVDCGGGDCAPCSSNQACTKADDCLSNQCTNSACVPLISLTYTPIDLGATTRTPKFRLNITYLDTVQMSLRDLTIRYYYNHNSVTEPVIGLDSQATIDPGNSQMDISTKVLTSVHRFPLGPKDGNGMITDSYLEIGFNDSTTVITGTKFVINQDLVSGNSDQTFDQNSHYSFMKTAGANQAVTVYRAGQRLWGVEPPMALFPECALASGVNMNGSALTLAGEALLAETAANLTVSGGAAYTNTTKVLPTTDATTSELLGTGLSLSTGESLVWPVPNGKYWAYAWLTSTASSDSGTLKFGASTADRFFGTVNSGGAHWALLGPYSVSVSADSLTITVDGNVHLAGMKLYEAAP